MTLRLLLWAVFAAIVAVLVFFTPALEKGVPASASQHAERKGLSSLEILLVPVDLWEFHEDGACNRLIASDAVYSYADRTILGNEVTISIGEEKSFRKIGESDLRASRAFWDFDGKRIELPDGGQAESAQGWKVDMEPAVFDLETRILSAPGKTYLNGPGLSVVGVGLRWDWMAEKIFLVSPVSRILPSSLP